MQPIVDISLGRELKVGDEELFRPSKFFPHIQEALLRRARNETVYRESNNPLLVKNRREITPTAMRMELQHHALASLELFADDLPIIGQSAKRAAIIKRLGETPRFISDHSTDKVLEMAIDIWNINRKRRALPDDEKASLAALEQDLARIAAVEVNADRPTRGDLLNLSRAILDETAPAAPEKVAQMGNPLLAGQVKRNVRGRISRATQQHRAAWRAQLMQARIA